jgi:hypothetical protein
MISNLQKSLSGIFLTSTSNVWRIALEKRGPSSMYSIILSSSSKTIHAYLDLYAILKVVTNVLIFAYSDNPKKSPGVRIFT